MKWVAETTFRTGSRATSAMTYREVADGRERDVA